MEGKKNKCRLKGGMNVYGKKTAVSPQLRGC